MISKENLKDMVSSNLIPNKILHKPTKKPTTEKLMAAKLLLTIKEEEPYSIGDPEGLEEEEDISE